jgi:hypothetical protein
MTSQNDRARASGLEEFRIYTRQHPRYSTSILARVENDPVMRESRGNISVGGFCFLADAPLEAGTRIEVLFRMPGAGFWLKGYGQVLASQAQNGSYAVRGRFDTFDGGDPELLRRWSEALARFRPGSQNPANFEQDEPDEVTLFSTLIEV